MGFTGQLFATRIAIGLAVPSPQALAKTGGLLARGISNIHQQVEQARRASSGGLGKYQTELNKMNGITTSTAQKMNNEIAVGLKRSLTKMDNVTNQSLSKSFNNTKKGYSKLKQVLSAPLSNQLMAGMSGKSGISAIIQQTQNLHNMGKANRMEIISSQEQIVTGAQKRLDIATQEVSKLGVLTDKNADKHAAALEEQRLSQKELQTQDEVLQNLRLMNKEIDSKVSKLKRAAQDRR